MNAWHRVGLESARNHPQYGRGGWLAFWFVDLVLVLVLILVSAFFQFLTVYYEYPDGEWVAQLVSLLVASVLAAYLTHTLFVGLRRIPVADGSSRFDDRFPKRAKILLGLFLLVGLYNLVPDFSSPSDGPIHIRLDYIINPVIFFFYFENSRRVRITYLNQVLATDPLLKTAEVIGKAPLSPDMIDDRHLLSAVMNPEVPPDIRADIRNKWADDAMDGKLTWKAREYMIEVHETYLGPYTPKSA